MKRLAMRKILDALRLQEQGLSPGRIGESLGIGRTTIQEYLSRVGAAGLSWPLPEGLADPELEERLYPRGAGIFQGSFPQPDWGYLHRELRRIEKGIFAGVNISCNTIAQKDINSHAQIFTNVPRFVTKAAFLAMFDLQN